MDHPHEHFETIVLPDKLATLSKTIKKYHRKPAIIAVMTATAPSQQKINIFAARDAGRYTSC
jgi:hypothetical protein